MEDKIIDLIEKLENMAPHMWEQLVVYQRTCALVGLFMGSVLVVISVFLIKAAIQESKKEIYKRNDLFSVGYPIVAFIFVTFAIILIGNNIAPALHPEAAAINALTRVHSN